MPKASFSWQPRYTRLVFIGLILVTAALAVTLTLLGLQEKVTYFYTPSDMKARLDTLLKEHKTIRLGGLVEKGSITHSGNDGMTIGFTVTDLQENLHVIYKGIPPDLFRDGQGVVAEGKMRDAGVFEAQLLLAKHDEKYMPPEVAKALKKAGHPEKQEAK